MVNDWDSDGGHDLIGEFFSSLSELQQKSGEVSAVQVFNCSLWCDETAVKFIVTWILDGRRIRNVMALSLLLMVCLALRINITLPFKEKNWKTVKANNIAQVVKKSFIFRPSYSYKFLMIILYSIQ